LNSLSLEIQTPDIIIFSADSGTGKGNLENISKEDIRKFIESKIIGSLNLLKMILDKDPERKIIAIWLSRSITSKPKHLILYSLVNAGLKSLVTELNTFYGNILNAYYLETPLVLPSTLGDSYINKYGNTSKVAQRPEEVAKRAIELINKKVSPGFIQLKNKEMRL